MQPVIKWTGSKRTQAEHIIQLLPDNINTYYEPFLGGGSMLIRLIEECEKGNKHVERFVATDLNIDLINIFRIIRDDPEHLIDDYRLRSNVLRLSEMSKGWECATEYYNSMRRIYNACEERDASRPYLLFFLTRTCFNGLIRYNSNGEFNTSFHVNRLGMEPDRMAKIIREWSRLLNKYDVRFGASSFEYVLPLVENKNDFVYLDPPYANLTSKVYQHDVFDNEKLFEMMRQLPCKYAMSYNGRVDDKDNTFNVPTDLYVRHEYIDAKNSAFRKIVSQKTKLVQESLYLNYEKP